MSGINYDLSRIRGMVFDMDGVLSASSVAVRNDGQLTRTINVKDSYALQLAAKCGIQIAVISGGASEGVAIYLARLGIKDILMNCGNKLTALQSWLDIRGINTDEALYMGDDIPDLRCLRHVALSCCPHDAASEVVHTCRYISRFNGGYGCVRDVIEQILKAQSLWMASDNAFHW